MIKADSRPVALYNAEKQELVAIFSTTVRAGKYVFPVEVLNKSTRISNALGRKTTILQNGLGFRVALRYASEAQRELLGGNEFWVKDGYPAPDEDSMRGFHTSRADHKENFKKRHKK